MKTIYLKDYTPSAFQIDTVDLHIELGETLTVVKSRLQMRHVGADPRVRPLVLQGQRMKLAEIRLDGRVLDSNEYTVDSEQLTLYPHTDNFTLEIETHIKPQENTELEGLYKSGSLFCTQCESHGFSKITYFLDRPDVMSIYTTTIVADKKKYPILLSNGNNRESGDFSDGRHWAKWEDPFKKPCYLFALVAGNLGCLEDHFVTVSGRRVTLRIFVDPGQEGKAAYAMESLKKAMRWDEEVYGREYDLDIFMIVAVRDFNMGAMENKGLNIFNAKYILANPEIATDTDYANIEAVVAHEYFHNWTGNRITCRDWFQLSLKEGLTVFRDHEFSSDMGSRAVERIDQVKLLRNVQFLEDAGPLAHPVRPESYIEMNNFYTATVYEKGSEVIRMLHTLLTPAGFRRGMDLYFERHDGQAVTCDDFVQAMEDANGVDLKQFRLWYSQAGTPQLHVSVCNNVLTIRQTGLPGQKPFHIPIAMGLLDEKGNEISPTRVLELRNEVETFELPDCEGRRPVLSLLRGFSAPVKLITEDTDADRLLRLIHDTDSFNRWDAGQALAIRTMLGKTNPEEYIKAIRQVLLDAELDEALKAQLLVLPTASEVGEFLDEVNVDVLCAARYSLRVELAKALQSLFDEEYHAPTSSSYDLSQLAIAQRALRNQCLRYLMLLDTPEYRAMCFRQFEQANNMTDTLAALQSLADSDCPERVQALEIFYERWKNEPLVLDQWFCIQAVSELPNRLAEVRLLLEHPLFDIKNPNRVRALIGGFCTGNFQQFHAVNGEGYTFLMEQVLRLDPINSQIAARLLTPLTRWRRYDQPRRELMRAALEKIAKTPNLSKGVYEVATKSLD